MNIKGFELTKHDVIYFRFENLPDLNIDKHFFINIADGSYTKTELDAEVKKEIEWHKKNKTDYILKKVKMICRDRVIKKNKINRGETIYNKYLTSIKEFLQNKYEELSHG